MSKRVLPISLTGCEDGNIDEYGEVELSCIPSFKEHSMSAEIRNKDKLKNAYWDKGFNEYIINSTMSFDGNTTIMVILASEYYFQ